MTIDPELLSWEVWTNELIKWSEQKYRYTMPTKAEIKQDKVITTYRKYLALFLKELNDKGSLNVSAPQPELTHRASSTSTNKQASESVNRVSETFIILIATNIWNQKNPRPNGR